MIFTIKVLAMIFSATFSEPVWVRNQPWTGNSHRHPICARNNNIATQSFRNNVYFRRFERDLNENFRFLVISVYNIVADRNEKKAASTFKM